MTSLRRKMWNRRRHRAFSMVEVVVSAAIVGVMMVAALNTVAASKLGQQNTGDRGKGALLAQQLMAEILPQAYADPEQPDQGIQIDSNESSYPRTDYDDVDDYNGWTASPPENKDGTVIPNRSAWARSVTVVWANAADPTQTSVIETGIKRITVTVTRGGDEVAALTALRTLARDNARAP
jgi:prepilin-type N-terminal cleavage/methylation domain-containing protein